MNVSARNLSHTALASINRLATRVQHAGFELDTDASELVEQVQALSESASAASLVAAFKAIDAASAAAPNVAGTTGCYEHDYFVVSCLDGRHFSFHRRELDTIAASRSPFPPSQFLQLASEQAPEGASAQSVHEAAVGLFAEMFGCASDWDAIRAAIKSLATLASDMGTANNDHLYPAKPEAGRRLPDAARDAILAVLPNAATAYVTSYNAVVVTNKGGLAPFPTFSDTKDCVLRFAKRHALPAKALWAAVVELRKCDAAALVHSFDA